MGVVDLEQARARFNAKAATKIAESGGWYRMAARADGEQADLYIYDEIGGGWFTEGVTAKKFIDDVRGLPAGVRTLRVHVNSPGGSVFDAITIANALRSESRDHGRTVEMVIEGLAASAATIITSAGDSILIAENAMMMIHNPLAVVVGAAPDMREMADVLDQVRESIIATYRWVSSLSKKTLGEMMDATTWMGAKEAVEHGFASEIMDPVHVAASFKLDALKALGEIPEGFRERIAALTSPGQPRPGNPEPEPIAPPAEAKYVLTACEGLTSKLAALLIDEPKATVDRRVGHAREVVMLCAASKLPELAEGYILDAVPVETVKQHLTIITARLDRVEIDSHRLPDDTGQAGGGMKISPTAIYEARKQSALVGARR